MTVIKKLEIKKLLKQLDFIESDYLYKNELINEIDTEFLNSVNNFLAYHPDVKEIFDKKISTKINNILTSRLETEPITDAEPTVVDKDPKLRKLFRKIAKITHPDITKDSEMNELYVKSKTHYESDDLSGLYLLCDQLKIDFEIDDIDTELIQEKILSLKNKIEFLESTVTWRWYNETDQTRKQKLIVDYITRRLHD